MIPLKILIISKLRATVTAEKTKKYTPFLNILWVITL